jgi:glycosyltransferase involved in cell wall biosynthesis
LQRHVQKWVCSLADHVLVNAVAVRTVLEAQGYDPSRISVIHNGIDLTRFRQFTETEGRTTVTAGAPLVAVFARLNRLKGIEYFLQAAATVARRFDTVRFLVVGDSISETYRAELEAFAKTLGLEHRVTFAGFRDDVPDLLSTVTVSVLPSLSEGLSNVVLEGMAAGVPVVATSVGGTPEMIDHGVTGLLVPPHDAASMADAITALLADPALARTIGRAGQQKVTQQFSLESTVAQTEHLYERLLRSSPGGRRVMARSSVSVPLSRTTRPLRDEEWG